MNQFGASPVRRLCACAVAAVVSTGAAAAADAPGAAPIPRDVIFAPHFDHEPQISGDGARLAFVSELGQSGSRRTRALIVAPVASPDQAALRLPDGDGCIIDYRWAANDRHLVVQIRPNCTDDSVAEGRKGFAVIGVDVATGDRRALSGPAPYRYRVQVGRKSGDNVLLTRDPRDPVSSSMERVNVRSGVSERTLTTLPIAEVFADPTLRPRLAIGRTPDGGFDLIALEAAGTSRSMGKYRIEERYGFRVLGIAADGRRALLIDTRARNMAAVVELDMGHGARRVVFEDAGGVRDALIDSVSDRLQAVKLGGDRPRWVAVDPAWAATFDFLRIRLGGSVSVGSRSRDDRIWIVGLDSDRAPRRHFLLDRSASSLRLLPGRLAPASESAFVPVRRVTISARDGAKLVGFLALPSTRAGGKEARTEPLPMVLKVHGGPAMHDSWKFDPTTQWLANRGYAVLAVNFRGSTGFGAEFVRAGHGEWGGAMQRDLIDAVKWAIGEGIADRHRIAAMGHSYGGYAALMGLGQTPEAFACGIDLSGPTDLQMFLADLDAFSRRASGAGQKAYVASQVARYRIEVLGSREAGAMDAARMKSPIDLVDRLVAPVLLIHGARDLGVSIRHAEKYFDRLASRGHRAALLRIADEGHVISGRTNVERWTSVAECFLARCLGGRFDRPAAPILGLARGELKTSGGLDLDCASKGR